jgi:SAM-dependent methyltransferase
MITFHDFEHAGWEQVGGAYHDYFAGLTSQTIGPLLDCVVSDNTRTLLDIASGPGYVAAEAKKRGVQVTGLDFSDFMVKKAKEAYPEITFVEGDAQELPFPDGTFDSACMNFGLLHLDQPEKALSEAHRVIAANGKFAFSVWATPEHSVAFKIVLAAIQEYGDPNVPLPPGPPFFRFSDPAESQRCMSEAGFVNCRGELVHLTWHLPSAADLFQAFYLGTPRTGGLLRAQKADCLRAIEDKVIQEATKFLHSSGKLELPMAAMVVSGSVS